MKKLLLLPVAIALIGLGFMTHKSVPVVKPEASAKTVTTQVSQPLNQIGDPQNGVTVSQVYAPATPVTSMDEVDPQYMLVAFAVSGASPLQLRDQSLIYTSDGQYLKPLGGNVKECPDCVVFIVPRTVLVDSFIYKDSVWVL